jgi:hypothetical protein
MASGYPAFSANFSVAFLPHSRKSGFAHVNESWNRSSMAQWGLTDVDPHTMATARRVPEYAVSTALGEDAP